MSQFWKSIVILTSLSPLTNVALSSSLLRNCCDLTQNPFTLIKEIDLSGLTSLCSQTNKEFINQAIKKIERELKKVKDLAIKVRKNPDSKLNYKTYLLTDLNREISDLNGVLKIYNQARDSKSYKTYPYKIRSTAQLQLAIQRTSKSDMPKLLNTFNQPYLIVNKYNKYDKYNNYSQNIKNRSWDQNDKPTASRSNRIQERLKEIRKKENESQNLFSNSHSKKSDQFSEKEIQINMAITFLRKTKMGSPGEYRPPNHEQAGNYAPPQSNDPGELLVNNPKAFKAITRNFTELKYILSEDPGLRRQLMHHINQTEALLNSKPNGKNIPLSSDKIVGPPKKSNHFDSQIIRPHLSMLIWTDFVNSQNSMNRFNKNPNDRLALQKAAVDEQLSWTAHAKTKFNSFLIEGCIQDYEGLNRREKDQTENNIRDELINYRHQALLELQLYEHDLDSIDLKGQQKSKHKKRLNNDKEDREDVAITLREVIDGQYAVNREFNNSPSSINEFQGHSQRTHLMNEFPKDSEFMFDKQNVDLRPLFTHISSDQGKANSCVPYSISSHTEQYRGNTANNDHRVRIDVAKTYGLLVASGWNIDPTQKNFTKQINQYTSDNSSRIFTVDDGVDLTSTQYEDVFSSTPLPLRTNQTAQNSAKPTFKQIKPLDNSLYPTSIQISTYDNPPKIQTFTQPLKSGQSVIALIRAKNYASIGSSIRYKPSYTDDGHAILIVGFDSSKLDLHDMENKPSFLFRDSSCNGPCRTSNMPAKRFLLQVGQSINLSNFQKK